MSAGHRHTYTHTSDTIRECRRLLKEPGIVAYMARKYRADFSHEIPLTGGSSRDGKVYFVDPDVPGPLRRFVLLHERFEKALRDVMGMSYDRAHTLATCAERMEVEASGRSWTKYKKDIAKPVRANKAQKQVKLPPHFDMGPTRAN